MPSDLSAALAIALIAVVTYGSRIAGALVMSRITISPRVERFLDGMSISVIAAIVASMLAQNGPGEPSPSAYSSNRYM